MSLKLNTKDEYCHKPENKIIDGIHYLNCGDWIENNTYIVYDNNVFILKSI